LRPSLAIVALAADLPFSPRGDRAHAVAAAASRVTEAELIGPSGHAGARRQLRRLAHIGAPRILDPWEPEAWWMLRRRRTRPHAALLVGYPVSGIYWGARWLVRERISYVVDIGDPWALTLPPGERPQMGGQRAGRCENFVWRFASGGIVTTERQADGLRRRFDRLPLMVRPNGYRPASPEAMPGRPDRDPRTLRLVHYGNLYEARLAVGPLLSCLAECGRWDSIVFTQQGKDWTGALRELPDTVRLEVCPPQSWDQVAGAASRHDLAVVIGNRNPGQLPSKAVEYLTLPIPRLAIVTGQTDDALASYVRDKSGWLSLRWDASPEIAGEAVAAHVSRPWSAQQLAAPPQESWEAVAETLVEFTLTVTAPARGLRPAQAAPRAIAAATSSHPR
jgi:hypothetical protein